MDRGRGGGTGGRARNARCRTRWAVLRPGGGGAVTGPSLSGVRGEGAAHTQARRSGPDATVSDEKRGGRKVKEDEIFSPRLRHKRVCVDRSPPPSLCAPPLAPLYRETRHGGPRPRRRRRAGGGGARRGERAPDWGVLAPFPAPRLPPRGRARERGHGLERTKRSQSPRPPPPPPSDLPPPPAPLQAVCPRRAGPAPAAPASRGGRVHRVWRDIHGERQSERGGGFGGWTRDETTTPRPPSLFPPTDRGRRPLAAGTGPVSGGGGRVAGYERERERHGGARVIDRLMDRIQH